MKDWILAFVSFIMNDWKGLLAGGGVVIGVVIFVMGCLKKALLNRIPNSAVRKTVLSLLSLILVAPATLASMLYDGVDLRYFWVLYGIHAVLTVFVYFMYEGTHLREAFALIGANTLGRVLKAVFKSHAEQELKAAYEESKTEAVNALKTQVRKHYNEKDLEDL